MQDRHSEIYYKRPLAHYKRGRIFFVFPVSSSKRFFPSVFFNLTKGLEPFGKKSKENRGIL
ncbi:hypothetical protein DLM75_10260 [Leptospira stimsonii]|uniref:Uncharacterized protein n=1 Tax=Leptospira stimsonii TaxID=2202203 RepID=A0A396ZCE6_9LEPT|nr:hypothetical protein DLM75_10260 [Leptospira stimsonii]